MKRQIAAGEFKAKCLHLLEEVQRRRKEIIVTKRGRAVARVLPAEPKPPAIFGRMKGTVEIMGDIVAPTGERWQADEQLTSAAQYELLDLAAIGREAPANAKYRQDYRASHCQGKYAALSEFRLRAVTA